MHVVCFTSIQCGQLFVSAKITLPGPEVQGLLGVRLQSLYTAVDEGVPGGADAEDDRGGSTCIDFPHSGSTRFEGGGDEEIRLPDRAAAS